MKIEKRQLTHPIAPAALRRPRAGVVPRMLGEGTALAFLLVITVFGLLAASQFRSGPRTNFADPAVDTGMDLIGINLAERNDSYSYSWTTAYTFAQIPHGLNVAHSYIATARLRSANPAGPQPLRFLANETPLATVTPATDFRTFRMLVSALPADDGALRLALATTPFTTTADTRQLGVMLTSIAFDPVHTPDWPGALVVGLALGGLWLILRWRGAAFWHAAAICVVAALALLVLSACYRPAPLAFPLLAVLALAGCAGAALAAPEWWSRAALSALALLVVWSGVLWPSWMTDDALISFRYAENLVMGNGLVYNVGERVEGYTNFLWTMLAALVLWLGGDPVWWAYVAGVMLALLIMLATYRLARRLLGPAAALLAAVFVATSQSLLIYTARGAGLETGLFTLLLLLASMWAVRPSAARNAGGWAVVGLLCALATLARPEGAVVLVLMAVYLVCKEHAAPANDARQVPHAGRWAAVVAPLAALLVGYAVIFVPFFAWRYSYYGEWLPNTFYAKTGGGLRQVARGFGYAGQFALAWGGPLLLLALLPAVAHMLQSRRTEAKRSTLSSIFYLLCSTLGSWRGLLLLLVGVYTLYIIAVGGDHFPGERFFVPLVPWLAVLFADGVWWLFERTRRRAGPWRVLAPAGLALLVALYSWYALERSAIWQSVNLSLGRSTNAIDTIMRGDDESAWVWRELGWWMADHSATGESIAAMGAGAVAYYSDHETIDLLGLNDKHIARVTVANFGEGTAGHEKRDPAYVLNERHPTYIPQIWDEYFGGEAGLRGTYRLETIQTRYGRSMELWKRVK